MTKPLYSGLAASLLLQLRAGNNTPGAADKQAQFWANNYQHGKTESFFLTEIQKIVGGKKLILYTFKEFDIKWVEAVIIG